MKVIKIIIGLVVIVLVVWFIASGGKGNKETSSVKIGLTLPLTGDLAFIGEADKNAALLVMDEIKSKTDLKHSYEVVIEDDSFNAQKGASTVNKLINIDKVNALISVGSTVGNVAAPIAEQSTIPHIGMASDPNVAKGKYNFINWTRPQEEVSEMISELKKRNLNKVAIIGVNQQGFQAIVDDLNAKAKLNGITVVSNEVFNPGQTDFRTIISKESKSNPQIYLLGAFDPEIGIIGKQMKDLGIKVPITSIESFGLMADPKIFEGQWFVDATIPTAEFSSAYEAKYGKTPGPAAANIYDSLHLIINAFEQDQNYTSDTVAKALENTANYTGALGTLTSGPDGAFISQASVKIIKDGKPEKI